ncbi:MAG: hypothetical protein N2258_01300 [Brevinematales bacterium]|nr:hypothetical protein [Brevinematales bacterium]
MINKLASSLGRNDEEPNIELAIELVKTENISNIKEIVENLHNDNEKIANDCIKVLYEIGYREPRLIADYYEQFLKLLKSKNNRLVWGGMIALSLIAFIKHKEIFENIDTVIKAYEEGSVITVDNSISVFAELIKANREYENTIFPIIMKHLETCRPKEVAQHSERAFVCINKDNSEQFKKVLFKRYDILNDAQRKRVDKLLKKIEEGEYCI